jgi:hypothetical protein
LDVVLAGVTDVVAAAVVSAADREAAKQACETQACFFALTNQ